MFLRSGLFRLLSKFHVRNSSMATMKGIWYVIVFHIEIETDATLCLTAFVSMYPICSLFLVNPSSIPLLLFSSHIIANYASIPSSLCKWQAFTATRRAQRQSSNKTITHNRFSFYFSLLYSFLSTRKTEWIICWDIDYKYASGGLYCKTRRL